MNVNEDYFKITKIEDTHILSDQVLFKWKEVLIVPIIVFVPLFYWVGWFQGLVAGLLAGIGYTLYRITSSLKYNEFHLNETTGKFSQLKKYKKKIIETLVLTEKYDPFNVSFKKITRSGNVKYLMMYRTHKEIELLVLKTKKDKDIVKDYFKNITTTTK